MNKKKTLIDNTLILAFGKISTQFISFLLLPLYTVFLSPSAYGTVDLIVTYLTLFIPAATLQLEMASFRFLVDARKSEKKKALIITNVMQMVTAILVIGVVCLVTLNVITPIHYMWLILLNAVTLAFNNIFLQFARGIGQNKKFAIASIFTSMATLAGAIIFIVILHLGAIGMLLSIASANLVSCIYLAISLKLYRHLSHRQFNRALQKELVTYSLPLIPNGISWWVINVSDRTIISTVLGVAANGIYAISNKYTTIFSGIFSIFSMAWTESASLHIKDKDRDAFFSKISNTSVRLFGSIGLLLIGGMPLVFPYIVGKEFREAYLYIPILVIGAFFNALVSLYGTIYVAKKMTKQVANTSIFAAIINIVLTIVFIKFFAIYAAAVATVIAYLAMTIYRHYKIKKHVTITYEKGIFVKLALIYTMVMVFYYTNNYIGNVANALIVLGVAAMWNKSVMNMLKEKVSMALPKKSSKKSHKTKKNEVTTDASFIQKIKHAPIISWLPKAMSALLVVTYILMVYGMTRIQLIPTKYLLIFAILSALPVGALSIVMAAKKLSKRKVAIYGILSAGIIALCLWIFSASSATFSFLDALQAKNNYTEYSIIAKKDQHISLQHNPSTGVVSSDPNFASIRSETSKRTKTTFTSYDSTAALIPALDAHERTAAVVQSSYLDLLKDTNSSFYKSVQVLATFSVETTIAPVKTDTTKPFVIYISGIDTYGNINTVSRSDVNILVVVNPRTNKILLVNTPRDYYVQLHGTTGLKDKLTHAGLYGVDMSEKTLEDLYSVPIDYYLRINFASLTNIIDTLGGVTVYSDNAFTAGGYTFKEGYQDMDGKQALVFSRERHSFEAGDRTRGADQERVIEAIIQKLENPQELAQYQAILAAISGSIQTNASTDTITSFLKQQVDTPHKWQVTSTAVDGTDKTAETYSTGSAQLYVMEPNQASVNAAKQRISQYLK